MTPFNPENKEVLTYGECLDPAMMITEEADAEQYKADYIAYIQRFLDQELREDDKTPEEIANINIGYYARYYDSETAARVQKLFKCSHPILGTIEKNN